MKEQFKEDFQEKEPPKNGKETSEFFLFISIDLVDFTKIKSDFSFKDWWGILYEFYKAFNGIKSKYSELKIWKILGDEIIFILPIISKAEYEQIPSLLLNIKSEAQKFEEKLSDEKQKENEQLNVQVKITAWLVEAYSGLNYPSNENLVNNVYFNTDTISNLDFQDFVGAQMDAGFRLKEASVPGAITLSVELFYVIFKLYKSYRNKRTIEKDTNTWDDISRIYENIRLAGFRKFKGVGNGAPYPIFWYSDNWEEIKNLYFTANYHDNDIIQFIYKNFKFDDDKNLISKHSFSDYEQSLYFKSIEKDKNIIQRIYKKRIKKTPKGSMLPLHIVVIVIYESNSKYLVLLRKRSKNKDIHPGKYDFGCAKLKETNSLERIQETVNQEYKADFGVEFKIDIEKNPPVATYYIHESNIFGVIYAEKIESDPQTPASITKVEINEALEMNPNQFVPHGLKNIRKACEKLDIPIKESTSNTYPA